MTTKKKAQSREPAKVAKPKGRGVAGMVGLVVLLCVALGVGALVLSRRNAGHEGSRYVARPRGEITFNQHIAPILHEHCAACHRPGEAGPFNLITYADAKKRATQIAEVTQKRLMPPWLPEDGHEKFLEERHLSAAQLGMIQQWASEGAVEGAGNPPAHPQWTEGWQLGPPDVAVTLPEAFPLPADGSDVYRNFVIPVPTTEKRYVRAVEFRTGSKAVHHVFIRFDRTQECRRLDAEDPGPGFAGMDIPPFVEDAGGHFTSWQPGALPYEAPKGLAWALPAGADLVVLIHMQPLGKAESVQASIGLYFTDVPPTNAPLKINLRAYGIDIAAGATDYTVEETTTIPVPIDLLAIKPHAHNLGKRLEGYALLPDGSRKTLLLIPQWDFNWQNAYRFATPVALPAGTRLGMRYSYDNSTNNARNPQQPPARVTYGLFTTNEMGELAYQMLTRTAGDFAKLQEALGVYKIDDSMRMHQARLRQNPTNAESIAELGKSLFFQGRKAEAEPLLRRAIGLRPDYADTHYSLGTLMLDQSRIAEAEQEFLTALRLNPEHFKARNNAGIACLRQNKLDEAERHFQEVLRLNPRDTVAKGNLDLIARTRRDALRGK